MNQILHDFLGGSHPELYLIGLNFIQSKMAAIAKNRKSFKWSDYALFQVQIFLKF